MIPAPTAAAWALTRGVRLPVTNTGGRDVPGTHGAPGPRERLWVRAADFVRGDAILGHVAAMTALLFVLHSEPVWFLRLPMVALCGAGLVVPALAQRAAFWFVGAAILAVVHTRLWYHVDNHEYLFTYWCLAMALARCTSRPREILAHNGRLLIGLCFLFATAWKVASPEFPDGSFFHHTFLFDDRFGEFARYAGGLGGDATAANRAALESLGRGAAPGDAVAVATTARLGRLGFGMAWVTIVLEGAVAVAFLWPRGRGPSRVRDAVLLLFLVGVYPLATVPGFGWLLAAMGLAQTEPDAVRTRLLYLAAFAVFPLYSVPFGEVYRVLTR